MNLTWEEVDFRLSKLPLKGEMVWGIPRGGSVCAGLARRFGVNVVESPESATVALDDIIDSGATAASVKERYSLPTVALVNKEAEGLDAWVHFPWEEPPDIDISESVRRIIEYIGEDATLPDLLATPSRVVKSWETLYGGYRVNPLDVLVWFDDPQVPPTDEMIIATGIKFYSTCEHHMLPFFGEIAIGYIPDGKVLGISKFSRLVDAYARRLQIQESLTQQIGEALETYVQGVAVHIEAQHLCMMARGVQQQGSTLTTNYLTGPFRDKPETRAEFLSAVTS